MKDSKKHKHTKREGRTSGFAIHYRHLGVDQRKMDKWILNYYNANRNLLAETLSGQRLHVKLSATAIAQGIYSPDRTYSLTGAAAYVREKQKYMKDLGLATKGNSITERMKSYIRALKNKGQNRDTLLKNFSIQMKLWCPQTMKTKGTISQNGYRHYRIRPLLMVLYTLEYAKSMQVEVTTDDLVLSALKYFPEDEYPLINEAFLMKHIRTYIKTKKSMGINYESEFTTLFSRIYSNKDAKKIVADEYAFQRKCRNAGNEAYCVLIFLRNIGFVNTQKVVPKTWSCTQQKYPGTPSVPEHNTVSLTHEGEKLLSCNIKKVPIWFEDIKKVCQNNVFELVAIINTLAKIAKYPVKGISKKTLEHLKALGLNPKVSRHHFIVKERPIFELQYDMPDAN